MRACTWLLCLGWLLFGPAALADPPCSNNPWLRKYVH